MTTYQLNVNGQMLQVQAEPDMPLLWVLRDLLQLTGTKFGCGIASCGACGVLVDGQTILSCIYPVSAAVDKKIITIEGLAKGEELHPVQQAWEELNVPQCGYCQSGQMMALAGLLRANPVPDATTLEATLNNVLCRCGTYSRIKKAAERAVVLYQQNQKP